MRESTLCADYSSFLYKIGVRAGAQTGYFVPGRDGIGGLDLAKNSSAAVAVVIAVAVRGEGEGGGGRDSNTCYTCAIVSYDYNSKLRLQ